MEDNKDWLIRGVNPMTITSIKKTNFYRVGKHSYYRKLFKKKHPILARLGFCDLYGYSVSAKVTIRVASGNYVVFKCRTNAEADTLHKNLNQKLNDFLTHVGGK